MNSFNKILPICACLLLFMSCGKKDDGSSYATTTRLKSSHLSSGTTFLSSKNFVTTSAAQSCPSGKQCLTPTNIQGRIYAGGIMVGGNGSSGYSLTTIGANEEVLRRPDLGKGGTLTFDLKNTTDLSGSYVCCGGTPYPEDAQAIVSRLEFSFDYIDTTMTVPSTAGSAVAGKTYTIRIVYVVDGTVKDVTSGSEVTLLKGDKLVKGPEDSGFKWCDSAGCTYTTRPSSPLQNSSIANAAPATQGNSNYVSFGVNLVEAFPFTEKEAKQAGWIFTADFDVSHAAEFNISAWSAITSVKALVEAFDLQGSPGSSNTSVNVSLTKSK